MGNIISDYYLNKQTDNLPNYKLEGRFRCKVVSVYDGDTVTIVLKNKGKYEKHKLRMYGYDSPEMKPRLNLKEREKHIALAKEAKDFLSNMVLNKIVIFESMGDDKYGRLLGNLILTEGWRKKGNSVNNAVLLAGHGYTYVGGAKRNP
jgi:endonuclease YncB( thermonuclease family)